MKPQNRLCRWADVPEKLKEKYLPKIQSVLQKAAPEFDSNGLRFPIEHLNAVGGAIALLPLEFAAEYADVITQKSIDSGEDKITADILSVNETNINYHEFNYWNATSIGNVAYIILHASTEEVRNHAEALLEKYIEWYLDKISAYINKGVAS